MGLRNARLNFRQQESTHIMENIVYNELLLRGYNVDVGVVDVYDKDKEGKRIRKQLEVDFCCKPRKSALLYPSSLRYDFRRKTDARVQFSA